jgi:diguanylate cyclase (GGDEF)-like protein
VYVLLLTAKNRHEEVVEGLDAGADDYVTKPCDPFELEARLRAGTRILELQDQLVNARETLRLQATHDSLTGLLNRTAVLDALQRELARSERTAAGLAVIMVDVDHFKAINDTHGHIVGDDVLRAVAGRMRSSIRTYDSIGRYGGEEFLVVAPGCGVAVARELAERLRTSVCGTAITYEDGSLDVTVSLGVAVRTGAPAGLLLRAADQALYQAKSRGRNRFEVD